VPTRVDPGGGVVGYIGVGVEALRAGGVGLDAIGGEEAAQARV